MTEYVVIDRDREVLAHRHELGKDLASGAFSAGLLWSDEKVVLNQHLTSATHPRAPQSGAEAVLEG